MNPYVKLDADLCDLKACHQECVVVCPGNTKGLNTITIEGDSALIHLEGCAGCLQCVPACPTSAITSLHATAKGGTETGAERPVVDPKAPYTVDDSVYQCFNEQDMIFARVKSDPGFDHYRQGIFTHSPAMIKAGKEGKGRAELALTSASWTVYDSYQQAFSWQELEGVSGKKAVGQAPPLDKIDPVDLAEKVKRAARLAGACDTGIAELDRRWIYTHDRHGEAFQLPAGVDKAVVMLVEMDQDGMATSPHWTSSAATGMGYSRMAFMQAILAEFIRDLGFTAIPAGNDTGISVPLAIDAGLGEVGRHGLLITPRWGSRVRICKVFTDLPLAIDDLLSLGTHRFCVTCKRCAEDCPSQSIPHDDEPTWEGYGKSNNPGVYKWYVNVESCYRFWVENGNECSNCVRACPFTKEEGRSHDLIRWFIKHAPPLNRVWLAGDKLMGYGKQKPADTFWDSKRRVKLR